MNVKRLELGEITTEIEGIARNLNLLAMLFSPDRNDEETPSRESTCYTLEAIEKHLNRITEDLHLIESDSTADKRKTATPTA